MPYRFGLAICLGCSSGCGDVGEPPEVDSTDGAPDTGSTGPSATDGGFTSGPAVICPGPGPAGNSPGDVIPAIDVIRCDGTQVSLQELTCGHPITLLDLGSAAFQECVDATDAYASSPAYTELKAQGLQIVQTFTQDNAGQLPTRSFCESYSEEHGIDFAFTIDQLGATTELTVTGPFNLVLDAEARILHQWDGEIPEDKIEILAELLASQ